MAVKTRGKRSQRIMLGFFPLIAIGGLFYPWLGYLMPPMMVFLIGLSYFKSRFWCGTLCPRGAFLDIVQSRFTLNRPYPRWFNRKDVRWGIFGFFMTVFITRLVSLWGNWLAVGGLFVSMCVVTSILAIAMGVLLKPRTWCAICPMGTLQDQLGRWGNARRRKLPASPRESA